MAPKDGLIELILKMCNPQTISNNIFKGHGSLVEIQINGGNTCISPSDPTPLKDFVLKILCLEMFHFSLNGEYCVKGNLLTTK